MCATSTSDGSLAVLVASCDAYSDLHRPFAELFARFWPDCPFKKILLTETEALDARFDRVIRTGWGKTWCRMLKEELDGIEADAILLLMDDYLLSAPVDTARFLRRLADFRRFRALNLRLLPNPRPPLPFPEGEGLGMYRKNTA